MSRLSTFANDLLGDLRDRRLLIPAIALLVAIVAVPVLLSAGGGGEQSGTGVPSAATAATAAISGAEQVDPVVVADVPGLRDYRKRLDGKGRNPFVQQVVETASGSGGGGGGGSGNGSSASGSAGSDSSSTGGSTSTSTGTSTDSGSGTSSAGGTSSGSTGGSSDSGGSGGSGSGGVDRLVTYTLDVRVGKVGSTKVLRGVKSLQVLPGKERPVVQYVNSNEVGEVAGFVVSPDVTSSEGDGRCDPGRNNCRFLLMSEGDVQRFVYGANADAYRLELLAINRKIVPLKRSGD